MKYCLDKSANLLTGITASKIKQSEKKFENTIDCAEYHYCGSHKAYLYELKFEIAKHYPDCNINWIKVGNSTIGKTPE